LGYMRQKKESQFKVWANKANKWWRKFHEKRLYKAKLGFISWFHPRYPGKYCWADCVSWAISPYKFNPFRIDNAVGCKNESETHSTRSCYCGGWNNGKCFDLLTEKQKQIARDDYYAGPDKKDDLPF
jgi:hypothetical protein